ncbi:MAG: YheU family protein [Pseudomonadales bacterium]|nr:YheU family protein [Pseudomonadales bacterium]
MSEQMVEVPWQELAPETLESLVQEFVTRDGTDYGASEISTEQKVEQVINGIKNKRWLIVFDTEQEQCNIVDKETWSQFQKT